MLAAFAICLRRSKTVLQTAPAVSTIGSFRSVTWSGVLSIMGGQPGSTTNQVSDGPPFFGAGGGPLPAGTQPVQVLKAMEMTETISAMRM